MKKFQFSLEKLLRYKKQLFDAERTVLADMNARLTRLNQELAQLNDTLSEGADTLRKRYTEGISATEIIQHKIYLNSVGESILQKEREIIFQQQAIDRQAEKIREAKIELSTIEHLKEKKLEEYTYLENKLHDQFIEEYVSTQKAMSMIS